MQLHLGTLYVVQLTTFSLLTLAVLLMGLRYPQEQALRHWGIGGVLASISMLLIALRPVIPAWLSVDLANIVLFVALSLTWSGALALEQRPVRWRVQLALVLLASVLLVGISNSPAYFEQRAALYSACYMLFNLLTLKVFISSPHRRRLGYRLICTLVLLLMLGQIARITLAMYFGHGGLAGSPYFALANFVLILLEFAKILALIFVCFEGLEIRLYQLAMRDPLTGLYNRRAFHEQAQQRLAAQAGATVALLVLDLDYFKQVNDRYGHQAGDDVLVHLARLLHAQLAPFDALYARSGGEEFVMMLTGNAANLAPVIAESIRSALAAYAIQTSDGQQVLQTTSIGIAGGTSAQGALRQLVMEADMALYQAKQHGRNCVRSSTQAL
ncbi:GGDEF domain-containing protein [Vogesella mureinivorans]|uniref:GGDEF domain-containing protein n=1 Tax=Vogesella mureinivorans TaxID=657276 RepID=UPI0011C80420|nr:GGDEF domain-containing protein [Vogesella mureinivorans]